MTSVIKNDMQQYREVSIPHESFEVANERVVKFCDELYELRNKYKIRDLLFVMRFSAIREDGMEAEATLTNHYGAAENMEGIAAYAYGELASRRQARIQDELDSSPSAIKKPKGRK